MKYSNKLRHDFSNNAIKVEVISKLVAQDLKEDKTPGSQILNDLKKVLNELTTMVEEIEKAH